MLYIATEDALSEAVAQKLVAQYTPFTNPMVLAPKGERGGYAHLRDNLAKYFALAQHAPVLLITDLDQQPCALALLKQWRQNLPPQPLNMILRVAVREIETWLLADTQGMRTLLNTTNIPHNIETIADPKKLLIKLASKAERSVRDDIVPRKNVVAAQGLGYNSRLIQFVKNTWNAERARQNCDSLSRCCKCLSELVL